MPSEIPPRPSPRPPTSPSMAPGIRLIYLEIQALRMTSNDRGTGHPWRITKCPIKEDALQSGRNGSRTNLSIYEMHIRPSPFMHAPSTNVKNNDYRRVNPVECINYCQLTLLTIDSTRFGLRAPELLGLIIIIGRMCALQIWEKHRPYRSGNMLVWVTTLTYILFWINTRYTR